LIECKEVTKRPLLTQNMATIVT